MGYPQHLHSLCTVIAWAIPKLQHFFHWSTIYPIFNFPCNTPIFSQSEKHTIVFLSGPSSNNKVSPHRIGTFFKDISRPWHCLPITIYVLFISGFFKYMFTAVPKTFQAHYSFILHQYRAFTLELLHYEGISGPLLWYYIMCSASKTIFSFDYLPYFRNSRKSGISRNTEFWNHEMLKIVELDICRNMEFLNCCNYRISGNIQF